MTAVFIVLGVVVWIVAGLLFAPYAAALSYNNNFYTRYYSNEPNKEWVLEGRKTAATNGFYWGLLAPFPTMGYWFFNQWIYHPIKNLAEGKGALSVNQALIRHAPDYSAAHLSDLERRNAALEAENMRLTGQVLEQ